MVKARTSRITLAALAACLFVASDAVAQPAPVPTVAPPIESAPSAPVGDSTPAEVVAPNTEPAQVDEPETIAPPPPWETKLRWNGYLDIGLFGTSGDGAGHIQDVGHLIFPQYDQIGWVFHGDPLSTSVNSRGEPADTGNAGGVSRAVTFDSVDSKGNPTFLVNEINLDLTVAPHRRVWLMTSLDFMPRGRNVAREGINLGDFTEIDLAFANWTAHDGGTHVVDLQVGKFDSVVGIEYRIQESPDRFGVTPSLIFRYLGGHPLGLKLRAKLWDNTVIAAASITNGSHFSELFPFADEQDSNAFKTGAGRLAFHHEGDEATVEVGGSGVFGAQDDQPMSTGVWQWQFGGDLAVTWSDFELRGEYVRGRARGQSDITRCDRAACLRFQGAYGELSYRMLNWFGMSMRVDWRDADHRDGDEFVYVVDLVRATVAARIEIDRFVIVKAEVTHSYELEGRPQIANDVATSSLVLFF